MTLDLEKITAGLDHLRAQVDIHPHPNWAGTQAIVTFPNGYGASVVLATGSYGVELGVLHHGHLTYDTPITGDVLGHLTPETLRQALLEIAALPPT